MQMAFFACILGFFGCHKNRLRLWGTWYNKPRLKDVEESKSVARLKAKEREETIIATELQPTTLSSALASTRLAGFARRPPPPRPRPPPRALRTLGRLS